MHTGTQTPIYRVFFPLLERQIPAQRSARHSASLVSHAAPRGNLTVNDRSYTKERSDKNRQEVLYKFARASGRCLSVKQENGHPMHIDR